VPDVRALRSSLAAFAVEVGRPLTPVQAGSLRLERRTTVVVAPRQSGKSRSLAVLALHRAFGSPRHRTLIVSAGEEAARRLLAEVRAIAAGSPLLRGSVVDEQAGLLTLSNASEVRSVPASERQVRGWSVDLLLVDEAAHVDDDLLLGAALPTTAARPQARVVLASSPGPMEGTFFSLAESDGAHAVTHRWSLVDAPWIGPGAVEAAREALAPEQFSREFEGRFADVGADERVVPRAWVEAARRRVLPASDPPSYGVDVARHGGDESVAVEVRGGACRVVWATRRDDLMALAGRVAQLAAVPGARVSVDAIGLGFGVVDRLVELGVSVHPFVASARSSDAQRWLNLRAEAWWHARELFRDGAVDLDSDDRLLADQLSGVSYKLAGTGAIQIGAKEEMRASPDRADALVVALWQARAREVMRAAVEQVRRARPGRGGNVVWRDAESTPAEIRRRGPRGTGDLW